MVIKFFKEFLKELWQNNYDPAHATYGIVGVISIVCNL